VLPLSISPSLDLRHILVVVDLRSLDVRALGPSPNFPAGMEDDYSSSDEAKHHAIVACGKLKDLTSKFVNPRVRPVSYLKLTYGLETVYDLRLFACIR
jgi:hypothetical protein